MARDWASNAVWTCFLAAISVPRHIWQEHDKGPHRKVLDFCDTPVEIGGQGLRQYSRAGVSGCPAERVLHQGSFQARGGCIPQLLPQLPPHVVQRIQGIKLIHTSLYISKSLGVCSGHIGQPR